MELSWLGICDLFSKRIALPQPEMHCQKLQGLINVGAVSLLRWLLLQNFFWYSVAASGETFQPVDATITQKNVEIYNRTNRTKLSSKTHVAETLCVRYMILIDCPSNQHYLLRTFSDK